MLNTLVKSVHEKALDLKADLKAWWTGTCPIHGKPDPKDRVWNKDLNPVCLKCLNEKKGA